MTVSSRKLQISITTLLYTYMNYNTKDNLTQNCTGTELKELRMDESFLWPQILNAELVWATNQQRIRHGLNPLTFSKGLQQIAIIHSRQMRQHKFFSHENPYEKQLRTLGDRISLLRHGLKTFCCYGENIAKYPMLKANTPYRVVVRNGKPHFYTDNGELLPYSCTEFAQTVVDGWMHSPGHRRNILNPAFRYIGCGCSRYAVKHPDHTMMTYLITQDFGG